MAALIPSEWKRILDYVQDHHPDLTRHWFDQLHAVDLDHGILEIRCANLPQQRYLSEHCTRPFAEAAQVETGRLISICFNTQRDAADLAASNGHLAESPSLFTDVPDQITPNPEYTFDQFVTGPGNRLAHAASIAVSDAPGKTYNPLFIHGSVGLGKTHLLQAVCHGARAKRSDLRILYLSCETFINHFIEAVEHGVIYQFRFRYRHVDLLLIDDIQFLAERERSQEEFFHTFNTLYQTRKQIVMSADCCPREIPSLEDRLVSRFNWGLVIRIDPPCLETRIAIVRKKAKLRNTDIPEDVAHYIASHIEGNARDLEGAINTIDALSQQLGKIINLATAQEALGDPLSLAKAITIPEILDLVGQHFNVKRSDLQGKRRNKSIVFPRQVCMHLARELTSHSLEEIGSYFGGRDHTTVLHSARLINRLQQKNPSLSETIMGLKSHLLNSVRT